MKKIALSLLLISVLSSISLIAEEERFKEVNRDEIQINFKGLEIVDFVRMVAKITGKNILISQKITGTVDYVSVKPIKKRNLYSLLVNVLSAKGFTLRDSQNGFLNVIKSADAAKSAPPMYGSSSVQEVQTSIISVQNLNVRTILRQINFLLSRYGKITLSYESNSVVVTDFPENIESIRNIIHRLDKSPSTKVRFVMLKNASAKVVYSKAKQIANSLFDNKISTQKVDVFSDDASNAVILVGNRANIRTLVPYIKKLDKANETVDKRMEIIHIKNADAVEVVKTLQKLLSDKSFAKQTTKESVRKSVTTQVSVAPKVPGSKGAPPAVTKTIEQPSIIATSQDKATVTVDVELNAVVIYATEREIKEIQHVISKLDIEREQVYVKAKVIEVSNNRAKALGAKYSILGGAVSGAGLYGVSANLGGVLDPVFALDKLSSKSLSIPELSKALAMGVTISLFENNGAANILSEPSILCLNNKESSIYVGQTESILSQSSTGDALNSVSRQNYTREDIGLTLTVKPRISADNKVSLTVKAVLEDVVPNTSKNQPTTTKREVSTAAIVSNGETVIIGGLIKNKEGKTVTKIPILGDIPILGNLFRHTSKSNDKTSLVIMLTPYIVKKSEDLGSLRDTLGKLDLLEKNLAIEFEENYAKNKEFFKKPIVEDIKPLPRRIEVISPSQEMISHVPVVEEHIIPMQETVVNYPLSSTHEELSSEYTTILQENHQILDTPTVTEEILPVQSAVYNSVEIQIDDDGKKYEVHFNESGQEISRKRLASNYDTEGEEFYESE